MAYHVHRDESPFFAQTGQELNLDDSDIYDDEDEEDEDLRSQVGGGSSETFEMVSSTGKRREDQYAIGGGGSHSSERLVEGDYVDAGPSTSAAAGRSGRLSASSVESFQLYTPDEELTVRRKFDRKLVLFVALLYMLSFLDRSSTLRYFSTKFTFAHRRCKTNKSSRYRQRAHRRHGRRPAVRPPSRQLVRVGSHVLLHCVHCVRVDVPLVETHPCSYLRLCAGHDVGDNGVAASHFRLVPDAHYIARSAGHRRGWVYGRSVLLELLLQETRIGFPHSHLHIWFVSFSLHLIIVLT